MIRPGDFHNLSEARSWALHREVANRLLSRPELLQRAQRRVAEWLERPGDHPYASDWHELLRGEVEQIMAALVSKDSQMCTLRQASPFAGALDNKTRWEILKQPGLRGREAG